MNVRVRIDEMMAERGWSAYDVAKAIKRSGVSEMAVYRLARVHGKVKRLDMRLLAGLCDVFKVEPGELLEREKKRR
jgi:DNA-binding Xre family transcriptional regulator